MTEYFKGKDFPKFTVLCLSVKSFPANLYRRNGRYTAQASIHESLLREIFHQFSPSKDSRYAALFLLFIS